MRIVIGTLSILFAACVVLVSMSNSTERVTVRFWPASSEYVYPGIPVSGVIFGSAFVGFLFTGIIAMLEGGKTRLSNARMRAQVRRLQKEIETLRRPSFDLAASPPSPAPAPPPLGGEAAEDSEGA